MPIMFSTAGQESGSLAAPGDGSGSGTASAVGLAVAVILVASILFAVGLYYRHKKVRILLLLYRLLRTSSLSRLRRERDGFKLFVPILVVFGTHMTSWYGFRYFKLSYCLCVIYSSVCLYRASQDDTARLIPTI